MDMIRAECKRPPDDEEDEGEEGEERDEFFPDGPPSPEVSERPRVINLLEMDYFKSLTEQTPQQVGHPSAPIRVTHFICDMNYDKFRSSVELYRPFA